MRRAGDTGIADDSRLTKEIPWNTKNAALRCCLPYLCQCFWNKGGWIQNRANTLALWCMFAQVFPLFQDTGVFAVLPVLYTDGVMNPAVRPGAADPTMQGVIAILALAANVCVLAAIIRRSVKQKKNPYRNEIFTDQRDFQLAMERAEAQ